MQHYVECTKNSCQQLALSNLPYIDKDLVSCFVFSRRITQHNFGNQLKANVSLLKATLKPDTKMLWCFKSFFEKNNPDKE